MRIARWLDPLEHPVLNAGLYIALLCAVIAFVIIATDRHAQHARWGPDDELRAARAEAALAELDKAAVPAPGAPDAAAAARDWLRKADALEGIAGMRWSRKAWRAERSRAADPQARLAQRLACQRRNAARLRLALDGEGGLDQAVPALRACGEKP